MLKLATVVLCAALCLPALSWPVLADEAGDVARKHLYAGTIGEGLSELKPYYERQDLEGRFGVGLLSFIQGVEHFAQGLYRHGFASPDAGPIMGSPLAMPVPVNPNPEPLDYDKFRAILQLLVDDMDAARDALLTAGETGDYVVPIEVLKVRIDLDGDGKGSDTESIGNVLNAMLGAATVPGPTDPGAPAPTPATPPDSTIGFDRADAIWLAGYTQILAAQADFLLAHDFRALFDTTFHRLFPRAGLPMQDYTRSTGTLMLDPESDNAIADALAAIHHLNWPVTDGDRLKRVLARFKDISALSRRNWEAILAETDDNRELLPSPKQTGITPEARVSEAQVKAWMATLDTADLILDGKLLLPHWRFQKGFDLKAYFESAKKTDLVMLITGYDALPFLKDGPIASAESFAEANAVFGDALIGYAFWFN
ncbi:MULTISPECIES: hypothetical protein [unclassified Devosia]|uniref:hypothetical protein n=1 Tax=unclassified Devosia TaxID=196773 RepID=UPI00086E2027|nr:MULTISPECIES: hypothetical protein [unclassified Devosia]MBN9363772.1 hypothetical protein [Devosia sp.]ODS95676.1 MAG: hypothetical protein ABS47_02735 [Devosia sp. SCN 66-27]OJX27060.1 MAG: hypothetical protein BGO83_24950 [Devosia sp. 66-14]